MLNKIKIYTNQIERLKYMTELQQDKLDSLVTPVFRAFLGIERGYPEEVYVRHDSVQIGYKFRWDDCLEHVDIPHKFFMADDPVKAATEFRNRSKAQKKAKAKIAHKRELLDELARLEEDEYEVD